jgi:hypothetical protein
MSEQDPQAGPGGQAPSEEELRAAYEAELKRIRVDDVIVQTVVSLLNLGGRRAGLAPGTEGERDLDQVRLAIEGVRALLPLIEDQLGPEAATLRDAISQLQIAYAQLSGQGAPGGPEGPRPGADEPGGQPAPGAERPGEPSAEPGAGPAQRSGRLWIPGQ